MVKAITHIPENLDTAHTWERICEYSKDILEKKDNVTPSQVSDLLVLIHNALFVNPRVEQTPEEKILKRRVELLSNLVTPIHTKVCNGCKVSNIEWMKLQLFISNNGRFFRE